MTELVRKIRYSKYYLLAIAFLIALFSTSFYMNALTESIEERTISVLRDTTSHLYNSINQKARDEWDIIRPLANFAAKEEDFLESEDLQQRMLDVQEAAGYDMVFIADKSGNTLTSVGEPLYVGDRAYFQKAIKGANVLSDVLVGRITNRTVICSAVPVYRREKVVGVVVASIAVERLRMISNASVFDGKGNVYITTKTGDMIVGSGPDNRFSLGDNIFYDFLKKAEGKEADTQKLIQGFHDDEEGFFPYAEKEQTRYAYYAPLGINGWYVFCTVPSEVIDEQTASLRRMAFWHGCGLLIAFILITIFVGLASKESHELLRERNRELEINERRFRMASSLYNNVVIEWNIGEKELIFLSGYENIATEPILRDFPESAVAQSLVHPDSAEEFVKLHREIPKGIDMISGEFRIMNREKKYIWCRLDELLLHDEEGNPIRTIGRITDIDREKKELEELKSKAKMDSGTGLYNKEATRLLVEECLKHEGAGRHALLIIDLDDFKDVNDSRGHLDGDRILREIADSMREIFRHSDIVGRIGGDEFMIFVRSCTDEKFLEGKIQTLFENVKKHSDVTLSVGISRYPEDARDFNALYRCADIAMYEAKARGKGTLAFYNS